MDPSKGFMVPGGPRGLDGSLDEGSDRGAALAGSPRSQSIPDPTHQQGRTTQNFHHLFPALDVSNKPRIGRIDRLPAFVALRDENLCTSVSNRLSMPTPKVPPRYNSVIRGVSG